MSEHSMLFSQLYSSFTSSLRWNALLYIAYKILFTASSILLFNFLSVNDFSVWANLNSITFLLLLWLDFGFRKSIPRYCPEFKKSGSISSFLYYLVGIHAAILGIMLPGFMVICSLFFQSLGLSYQSILLYLCSGIFFVEGINSTVRLFYHAHYWNKRYTLIQTIFLLSEGIINLICIMFFPLKALLMTLFLNKLIVSSCNATMSFVMLAYYYKKGFENQAGHKEHKIPIKEFFVHSGMMWLGISIKSITERNFLVPFISYIINPASANLFKLANDWAMLIHRPIIKTIGTSDTALLSHVHSGDYHSLPLINVCKKLITTTVLISIPFGCTIPVASFMMPSTAVVMFLIIICGHIIETLLSPYERLLEVKRNYTYLLVSYIPYVCILLSTLYYLYLPSSNLLFAIILIHTARLSGSCLMVFFAHKTYARSLPITAATSYQKQKQVYPIKQSNTQSLQQPHT